MSAGSSQSSPINWARYAARREIAFWGLWALIILVAMSASDGFRWSILWPLLMLGWCVLRIAKALNMKLVLCDDGIEYRKWFRTKVIKYGEVSSLTNSQWDGGWLVIGSVAKRIRVLEVRRRKVKAK